MNKKLVLIIGVLVLASFSISACGATPSAAAQAMATTGHVPRDARVARHTQSHAPLERGGRPKEAPAAAGTTAEGRVLPLQSANLSFNVGGHVAEILVKEGATVKAGDVIARLRNDSLRAAVDEAQAGVDSAKAAQVNYQMQLPKQIAEAQAEVKVAQARQVRASAGRDNQAAILEAESALVQAKYNQQQIETVLDLLYVYDRASGSRANDVRLQVQSAIAATQAAQARLDALKSGSPSDRANSAQIAAASAGEKAAQVRLDQLKAEAEGKTADTYQAAIQQAEAALLSARLALSETEIRAPFAGTIAKIDLKLGEQVTAGTPAIVLADLSGWRVETKDLTEIKVPLVRVGQSVTVNVDALPGVELKGKVASIGGVSQLNGGDVVYPAKIDLIDTDPRLRWGMTAVVKFE